MEFRTDLPIYMQIVEKIKSDLISGKLSLAEKLPSRKELALQFQVNPNTADRVYRQLEQEGLCFSKRGLGTYVTEKAERVLRLKEEMAKEKVMRFKQEMQALGFTEEEILAQIRE